VNLRNFILGDSMYLKLRFFVFLAVLMMATGCSIMHPVAEDYAKYLSNNKGEGKFETAKVTNQYYLPAATQNHRYEFRAATTGYANVWVVEFGKVLDATIQSKDVVDALGPLAKAGAEAQGSGNTMIFDLQKYTFENFGAHISLTITVKSANRETFKKTYTADGKTQGGKMFWGGAFGMKNAVQQSTKLAMDEIITTFIRDLKASNVVASAK
jgi:hypothetical protein